MGDLTRQSARAEVLYAEGHPLGVVLSAGLPFRRELARVARRILRGTAAVADVLQQVHVDAWRTLAGGVWPVKDLRTLLLYMTKQRAIDAYRRARRDGRLLQALVQAGAGGPTPLTVSAETRGMVVDLFHVLTPAQWDLWMAVRVHGVAHEAAAASLGISVKAVERRLARIQARINQYIEGGQS